MLDDANPVETPTEAPVDAPVSQPAEGGDTPAETSAPATGSAPQEQGSQQPQTIPKWRFDELNQRMHAAEARLREVTQPQVPQPAVAQPPREEDFADFGAYNKAVIAYEVQQGIQQHAQRQQAQAQQQYEQNREYTADQNWSQKASEAAQKYPDFIDKVNAAPRLNKVLAAVLKPSQMAGDLAYHLAGQPDTIVKLNGMHPLDAIAEMGRIEARLQGSSGQTPAKVSQMPKPMTPVGTGKATGGNGEMNLSKALSILYPS